MDTLIIIPTYNEAKNIEPLIDKIFRIIPKVDILIIDDNSPDKTHDIVKKIKDERIKLIRRKRKMGLGTAYIKGFDFAIDNGYKYVFEMDADFSHSPKIIPKMLKKAEKYDLVIGSRYIDGLNVVNWPLSRLLLSYFASFYVRLLTGMKIKDPTSGFKCYKISTIKAINHKKIKSEGYSFQIETNYRVFEKGLKIKEIPIIFIDRKDGVSKMNLKIIFEAIFMVWRLKIFRSKKS